MKLNPNYLKRYKDLVMLYYKYNQAELGSPIQAEADAKAAPSDSRAQELPDDLERLGPTFVKLGQLLSSRADLLPGPYLSALQRLQDRVKPFPFAEVEAIVESELGARLNKAFLSFEHEPLAAASLGQVHRAVLHQGRPVVVKVQRPHIAAQIEQDFGALTQLADFLHRHTRLGRRYQLPRLLEEFHTTIAHELDYRREAANLVALRSALRKFPHIILPAPVDDYTTHKVLTMEYVEGTKITGLSPLARLDLNGGGLAEELFQAYLQQILIEGVFHADPHPGNVFLTHDRRIALLDLGMVGHTTPVMQENLLKLLLAVSEGAGDDAAELAIRMSHPALDFDEVTFRHRIAELVAEQQNSSLSEMDVGKVVLQVGRAAADTGLFVPPELSLLGKTLLQLDQVGRILDPAFDPNESVRRNASKILHQRLKSTFSESRIFSTLLETKQFIGALPSRLNKILDALGNAQLNVNVKPSETEFLVESARKVANRITTGLVLAALIVGAALLMRIPTSFRLFGYPGLAIIFFLVAAAGGLWLLCSIFWQDHLAKQKSHRRT